MTPSGTESDKVKTRINVTHIPEVNNLEASFTLNNIELDDGTLYKCDVTYLDDVTFQVAHVSGTTDLNVVGIGIFIRLGLTSLLHVIVAI